MKPAEIILRNITETFTRARLNTGMILRINVLFVLLSGTIQENLTYSQRSPLLEKLSSKLSLPGFGIRMTPFCKVRTGIPPASVKITVNGVERSISPLEKLDSKDAQNTYNSDPIQLSSTTTGKLKLSIACHAENAAGSHQIWLNVTVKGSLLECSARSNNYLTVDVSIRTSSKNKVDQVDDVVPIQDVKRRNTYQKKPISRQTIRLNKDKEIWCDAFALQVKEHKLKTKHNLHLSVSTIVQIMFMAIFAAALMIAGSFIFYVLIFKF